MEAALPIILRWIIAGLPEMVKALQAMPAAQPGAVAPALPAAPLNPLGWPSPLPPEAPDAPAQDAAAPVSKGGNSGIRLLQIALVAAGQQVDVDGVSGPKTEKALAAVVQHIMSRVG